MILQPGCRFVVAPHFHLPADWARRLLVGAGINEVDGSFFAHPSWRPPTAEELAVLVEPGAEATPAVDLETCVCLFHLAGHIQSGWWHLLEQAAGVLADGRIPGFETFVSQVVDFLAFKNLAVPEGARCDVVVSNSGGNSFSARPEVDRPVGLHCTLAPWTPWPGAEDFGCQRLWGVINLGEEPTSVVLINLPCRHLDAELRRLYPDQPLPATVGGLVGQFLRCRSDYASLRLILGPGEGCRLPRGGLILDSYLGDKQEPDVLLLISQEGERSPEKV
jgi:hypothetical protein